MRPHEYQLDRSYTNAYSDAAINANSGAAPKAPAIPEDRVEFARLIGFEPDAKQIAILRSPTTRGIVVGSRQCGKSTLLALMAAHRALAEPKCLVLLLGPYSRQAGEILEKAKDFLEQLGLRTPGDGRHRNSIRLPNRSRIIAVPAVRDRVRCFSAVRLLVIDEAAFVRRGFFYKVWTEGKDDRWAKFSISAEDCPRIPAGYLEEEREVLTESEFRQEFFCAFVDPNQAVFRREVLLRAIDPNITELQYERTNLANNIPLLHRCRLRQRARLHSDRCHRAGRTHAAGARSGHVRAPDLESAS